MVGIVEALTALGIVSLLIGLLIVLIFTCIFVSALYMVVSIVKNMGDMDMEHDHDRL